MTTELDTRTRRKDLTSRECMSLLGGLFGGLCYVHGNAVVRRAVVFAASQPDWPFAVDEGARSVSGFKDPRVERAQETLS
jgi:hypothetical protein